MSIFTKNKGAQPGGDADPTASDVRPGHATKPSFAKAKGANPAPPALPAPAARAGAAVPNVAAAPAAAAAESAPDKHAPSERELAVADNVILISRKTDGGDVSRYLARLSKLLGRQLELFACSYEEVVITDFSNVPALPALNDTICRLVQNLHELARALRIELRLVGSESFGRVLAGAKETRGLTLYHDLPEALAAAPEEPPPPDAQYRSTSSGMLALACDGGGRYRVWLLDSDRAVRTVYEVVSGKIEFDDQSLARVALKLNGNHLKGTGASLPRPEAPATLYVWVGNQVENAGVRILAGDSDE